jgi:hypothetical protein
MSRESSIEILGSLNVESDKAPTALFRVSDARLGGCLIPDSEADSLCFPGACSMLPDDPNEDRELSIDCMNAKHVSSSQASICRLLQRAGARQGLVVAGVAPAVVRTSLVTLS